MSAATELQRLIANSAAFRSECGAADATAALAFIFIEDAPGSGLPVSAGQLNKMYALISSAPGNDEERAVAGGGATVMSASGTLEVQFVRPRTESADADAMAAFTAAISSIRAEIWALAGTNDYLHLRGLKKTQGPFWTMEDDIKIGKACLASYEAAWGWE